LSRAKSSSASVRARLSAERPERPTHTLIGQHQFDIDRQLAILPAFQRARSGATSAKSSGAITAHSRKSMVLCEPCSRKPSTTRRPMACP
jgi:hypothetical protein